MSNFMGASTGQPVATQATRYGGMQVQGSQYGLGLTIVYGQQRIPGNLIWYGDFQSVEHAQSVGKGGGGVSTSYTYSSSFQLALCEGPISGLVTIWKDSGTTTLSDINGTFSTGASGQAAWSHLSGSAALQYTNVAWIGCLNLALGGSPNVPNFNFEIAGMLQYDPTGSPAIIDADPSAIFSDLLTSTTHGLGFGYLGDLTQYSDYCVANNLFLSLKVDQQTTMNEVLTRLLQITNSNTAWSNGKLIVIPYGDESVTANGVTYTPATTVQKYFQDSDYIKPVRVDRKPLSDLYNVIRVEYVDRANNYNTSVAEAKDQADIDTTFSVRQQEIIQGHAITNGTLAQWIAQTILQRALYIRNTYTFTTTMENVAFEPGDVIALTDSQAELVNEPVRIKSISEQGTNELQFVCEEFPAGVAVGATQTVEPAAGYVPSVNGAPDATQAAVIFRAPQFLTNGVPEVWIGVGGAGPNWGGANILVSRDDISYTKIGTVAPGCRYGELTAALADSTADPDTTDSFGVSLYAGGTLSGGTDADADNLTTLMLVDQELVAYASTVLNGDGTYTLGNGYLRRQCYQTAHAAHAIGAPWIRVDNSVFRWQVDPSWVGQTVYIKIQPWNLYGGGLVSESALTAITYVVGTAEEIPDTPPTPTSLVASGAVNGVLLTWDNPNPAAVAITSVESSTNGTTWSVLGQVQGTHYAHVFSGNATWYYRIRARSSSFIWSAYTSTVSATGGSVDYGADGTAFVRLLASRAAGNVAFNFRGIWSSTVAYLKGDEVVEGQTYWVATAPNTNSAPATGSANWQAVGSYAAYQGAWNATTAYVPGAEVTDAGNYWICVTGNTNSAPATSNANWVMAGPQAMDNIADGPTTYYRVPLSHFDNATNRNWNLGYTVDGPARFAVVNASGMGGVSYWDANNNPRIDFTGAYHIGKSLANVPDATGRYAVTNMGSGNAVSSVDGNNRALIDFSQAGHLNAAVIKGETPVVTAPQAVTQVNSGTWANLGSAGTSTYFPPNSFAADVYVPSDTLVDITVSPSQTSGSTNGYMFRVSANGNSGGNGCEIWRVDAGVFSKIATNTVQLGTGWHTVKVLISSPQTFGLYVDGGLQLTVADSTYTVASGSPFAYSYDLTGPAAIAPPGAYTGYMDSTRRVSTVEGGISPLGSIVTGGAQIAFSYTSTTNSITISWTLPGTTNTDPIVLRMDGTQTSIPYGSVTITGLASATAFVAAPYVDEANETIAFVTGETGATGSPAILYPGSALPTAVSWQQSLQGNLPLGTFQVSTTSSGGGGGNGSTGCCLHGDQLIECMHKGVLDRIPARELTTEHRLFSLPGCIRIVALRTEPWAEWYRVRFCNGTTLVVAGDHRFVDPCGEQVHAKDLLLQQVLQSADGYVEVVQLELDRNPNDKVSIEVEEPHVYFVDGILAHNKVLC